MSRWRRARFSSMAEVERRESEESPPFFWLLWAWFAFEYVRPQDYLHGLAPLRIPLGLLVLLAVAYLLRGDKGLLRDGLVRLNLAFIVLTAASAAWAVNLFWVAQNTLFLVSYCVASLAFASFINGPAALVRFLSWWVLFNVVVAVTSMARGGTGSGSFLGDENDLALTLAVAFPYAWYLATNSSFSAARRFLFLCAAALLALGVMVSMSRGGFLGIACAIGTIIWFSRHRVRNFVIAAIIAGVAAISLVPATYVNEMETITDKQDNTRLTRFYYWKRGFEMFADNPVLGVGSGNYPWRIMDYEFRNPSEDARGRLHGGRVAHSLYVTLLAEYGAIGTLVFAAAAITITVRLVRIRRRFIAHGNEELAGVASAALGSLVALLVSGAFLTVLYYPHLWYLLGFALALCVADSRMQSAGESEGTLPSLGERRRLARVAAQAALGKGTATPQGAEREMQ